MRANKDVVICMRVCELISFEVSNMNYNLLIHLKLTVIEVIYVYTQLLLR